MNDVPLLPGDLVIYRTLKHGVRIAVFLGFVGSKALVRVASEERTVNLKSLETL